jgi:hypothetical protein
MKELRGNPDGTVTIIDNRTLDEAKAGNIERVQKDAAELVDPLATTTEITAARTRRTAAIAAVNAATTNDEADAVKL